MIFEVTFDNEPDYKLFAIALKELYEKTEAQKLLEEKKKLEQEKKTSNSEG